MECAVCAWRRWLCKRWRSCCCRCCKASDGRCLAAGAARLLLHCSPPHSPAARARAHLHPQAFYALSGSPTAYSGAPGAAQTDAKLAGGGMALVALAQMRNNARVAVAGSTHMWSDEAWAATGTDRAGKRCGVGCRCCCRERAGKWAACWAEERAQQPALYGSRLAHRASRSGVPGWGTCAAAAHRPQATAVPCPCTPAASLPHPPTLCPLLPSAASLGRVANEAFCQAVSKWAFQERGVLRASNLSHAVLAGAHPGAVRPERYRINDEVEFSVLVQECADGTCGPYKCAWSGCAGLCRAGLGAGELRACRACLICLRALPHPAPAPLLVVPHPFPRADAAAAAAASPRLSPCPPAGRTTCRWSW